MLLLLALACAPETDAVNAYAAALSLAGDAEAGAGIYAEGCADCHGAAGEGGSGPAIEEDVPVMPDERIVARVMGGYDSDQPGAMPAQTGLSDQDMADCLAWLREQFGGPP